MSLRWFRWRWLAATLVVAVGVLVARRLVPPAVDSLLAEQRFLGSQIAASARAELSFEAEPFRLHARVEVALEGLDDEVCFVLEPELRIVSARLGDVELREVHPAWTSTLSHARSRRRLVADGGTVSASGTLTLEYEGSPLALTRTDPARPLPLVLAPTRDYLPRFGPESPDVSLTVQAPVGLTSPWSLVSDAEVSPRGEGTWAVESAGATPVLVLGTFDIVEPTELYPLRVLLAGQPKPPKSLLAISAKRVGGVLSVLLPSQLLVVLTDNATGPERLSDGALLAPLSDRRIDLVRAIAWGAGTVDDHGEGAALAEVVGLYDLQQREGVLPYERPSLDPMNHPTYAGWLALLGGVADVDAGRWLKMRVAAWANAEPPPPVGGPGAAELEKWARAGCRVSFVERTVRMVNERWDVDLEVLLEPEPPGPPPPLTVSMVTRDGGLTELDVEWDGARGRVREQLVEEEPMRFVLDAQHKFPDSDRSDNVLTRFRELEPDRFAVDRTTGSVALSPASQGSVEQRGDGLYLCDVGDDGDERIQWFPLRSRVESVRWLPNGRSLFLQMDVDDGQHVLLDSKDGHERRFPEASAPSPSGGHVLTNVLRAPGRWSHQLYDVARRREQAFANDLPTPLRWVEGIDAVWGGDGAGATEIRALDGRLLARVERSPVELRLLRHNQRLGFTYVMERADGSSLVQLGVEDGDSKTLYRDEEGRITDYSYSTNPGELYAFIDSRTTSGLTVVHDFSFKNNRKGVKYRGPARPLPGVHLPTGRLLTVSTEDPDVVALHYLPFTAERPELSEKTLLSAAACLDPPPVASDEGRYLSFVQLQSFARADDQPALAARYRRRSLVRFDFLSDQLESVLAITGR